MNNILNSALLHAEGGTEGIFHFITEGLGDFGRFLVEVVIHGIGEALTLVPFLFLTYLLMEFIEHKASDKTRLFMKRSGKLGPLVGGAFGALPQCGFSAAAANLYTGRVVTLGTLVAVFLSTSDEMIPIFMGGGVGATKLLLIIIYKIVVAVAAGFAIDGVCALMHIGGEDINIDEICDEDGCHCERGILRSALHHTLSVALWCLLVILALNAAVFFIGEEALASIIPDIPLISHLICAVIGLIPNCAASVALSELALSGIITTGEMLSGLFAGAGVGLFVLFKMNKRIKENLIVVGLVLLVGVVFGAIADLIPFLAI